MPAQQYGVQGYGMQPYQLPLTQTTPPEGQQRLPRGYSRQQEHAGSQHQPRPHSVNSQSRAQQSAGDSKARPAPQPTAPASAGASCRLPFLASAPRIGFKNLTACRTNAPRRQLDILFCS
jgi:hypothetical protein